MIVGLVLITSYKSTDNRDMFSSVDFEAGEERALGNIGRRLKLKNGKIDEKVYTKEDGPGKYGETLGLQNPWWEHILIDYIIG